MGKSRGELQREQTREELWPNSAGEIWKGANERGYWPAPRVLPLILSLLDELSGKGKECARVYLDLLSRDFGQGLVEVRDEVDHAYCAGFVTERGPRSWHERVIILRELGFICIAPRGRRKVGYILLVHPLLAVKRLRESGRASDQWWNMFRDQLRAVGASWPEDEGLRLVEGGKEKGGREGSR